MIQTTLNYLAGWSAEDPRPYYSNYPPEGERRWRNTRGDRRLMNIKDARRLATPPHLDREGFELIRWSGPKTDFNNEQAIRADYYAAVEQEVAEITGSAKVVAFDHNVRSNASDEARQEEAARPVRFVHNDYTLDSAPQRVHDVMGKEAPDLLRGRFAIINLWKPIIGPVEEMPLAILDAQGLAIEDFVETDLLYPDRVGCIYSVRWSADHRWYYYPDQTTQEALLLKCYDSDPTVSCFTAHSAVEDPLSPENSQPRESIEVRTLAFWPKSSVS